MSDRLKVTQVNQFLIQQLSHLYDPNEASVISKLSIEYVTGLSWFDLRLQNRDYLSSLQATQLEDILERLLMGQPIQYITQQAHFYGRTFFVNPHVLIPRQETEELAIWIRDEVPQLIKTTTLNVLDIGTGSGCIPITLALEWNHRSITHHITGIDVDPEALQVAKINAERFQVAINWVQSDIQNTAPNAFEDLDVIVSNPPYIPQSEKSTLHPNVANHEPSLALFVSDEDPLYFYRIIGELAYTWLSPTGVLYLEIHADYGPLVTQLLYDRGWSAVTLRKDLNGRDRMVRAQKTPIVT